MSVIHLLRFCFVIFYSDSTADSFPTRIKSLSSSTAPHLPCNSSANIHVNLLSPTFHSLRSLWLNRENLPEKGIESQIPIPALNYLYKRKRKKSQPENFRNILQFFRRVFLSCTQKPASEDLKAAISYASERRCINCGAWNLNIYSCNSSSSSAWWEGGVRWGAWLREVKEFYDFFSCIGDLIVSRALRRGLLPEISIIKLWKKQQNRRTQNNDGQGKEQRAKLFIKMRLQRASPGMWESTINNKSCQARRAKVEEKLLVTALGLARPFCLAPRRQHKRILIWDLQQANRLGDDDRIFRTRRVSLSARGISIVHHECDASKKSRQESPSFTFFSINFRPKQ